MKENRKKTEDFIISNIEKIAKGLGNKKIYTDFFARLSNKAFDELMTNIEEGKTILPIFIPPNGVKQVSVENNKKVANSLGHDFMSRLTIKGKEGVPDHTTPIKFMVLELPIKRASQMTSKGISVPDDTRVVDSMTGQPTGASKGAKISYPELLMLSSMGLDMSIEELITIRGGDLKAYSAYTGIMSRYGKVSLKNLENFRSGVVSNATLKTYLTAMHLKTNL